jgi:hypothetical protein
VEFRSKAEDRAHIKADRLDILDRRPKANQMERHREFGAAQHRTPPHGHKRRHCEFGAALSHEYCALFPAGNQVRRGVAAVPLFRFALLNFASVLGLFRLSRFKRMQLFFFRCHECAQKFRRLSISKGTRVN